MPTMYGMDLDRVIEVLREMLQLARENRCVYCGWPISDSDKTVGCQSGRCSYIPTTGSFEEKKIKERYAVMGYDKV